MKKIILAALVCMGMSLISCDKIKEMTSKDITVNGVNLNFPITINAAAVAPGEMQLFSAAAPRSFNVTTRVHLDELGKPDMVEWANKITKVAVTNSVVTVTANPSGNYIVENLNITAVTVSGSLIVPTYTFGNPFTLTTEMKAFTGGLFFKLLRDKVLDVTIKGDTDAPAGTIININYKSDLVLTASLL